LYIDTVSEDTDEQPDYTVLCNKEALNDFLIRKGFVGFAGVNHRSFPGTMLEQSLVEFTKLDVLDENNKFICHQCSSGM